MLKNRIEVCLISMLIGIRQGRRLFNNIMLHLMILFLKIKSIGLIIILLILNDKICNRKIEIR